MSDNETPDAESSGDDAVPSATHSDADTSASPENAPTRRNILVEGVTALISFLLVAVPSAIAGIFYLDPILRKKGAGGGGEGGELDGFIQLPVTRDVVPEDGQPIAVTVKATLDDAWNRFKDVPVGSVWLRKQPSGEIMAFSSVCPHLGCSVNYRRSEGDFFCPCHTSSFDLDGKKTNEVPPRDMDDLQIKTATNGAVDENGQELWLKYQNFKGGKTEQVPV